MQLGVLHQFVAAFMGIAIFLFFDTRNVNNKAVSRTALLILLIFLAIGISKTFYSHVRYFYFTYPLLLLYSASLSIFLWNILRRYSYGKIACVATIGIFFMFEIIFSWQVINAEIGSEKPFSYIPIYVDYKTPGSYLQENRSNGDYVIAFAPPHQAAVYCGTVDVCYRPALMEHRGDLHYITGSKYFDTKEDLEKMIAENPHIKNIWIIFSKRCFKSGSWQYELMERIKHFIVCEALDNNTLLIKISPSDFLKYLK